MTTTTATEIKPMLLQEINSEIPIEDLRDVNKVSQYITTKYPNWLVQEKENGDRVIVFIKNGQIIGMRNRRNMPYYPLFPEFKELTFPFDLAILDAELTIRDENDKSVFYTLKHNKDAGLTINNIKKAGINLRTRSLKSDEYIKRFPAKLIVFDILRYENESMLMKPYEYRYAKIAEIIQPNKLIDIAKLWNFPELWKKVIDENREGVVLKNPKACYELDKRSNNYLKLKNYKLAEVEVTAIENNSAGTKIYGKVNIDGVDIEAECQFGGIDNIVVGSKVKVKYLDIIDNKFIQPTKV